MRLIDYPAEDQAYFIDTFLSKCKHLIDKKESSSDTIKPNLDAFLLSQIKIND